MHKSYNLNWLKDKIAQGENPTYLYFWGHTPKQNELIDKSCLSQWFPAPFTVDGILYISAEHWMMAQKALLFGDKQIFEAVIRCSSPVEAKKLGRKVANYQEELWNKEKYEIVKEGNRHKFTQNAELGTFLIETGADIIVEASPYDAIWGIGLSQNDKKIGDIAAWGENLLGFALMEVRDFLNN